MQTSTAKQDTNNKENHGLQRRLKARHLTMISLGGCIGTGLFLASGGAIHTAGPGGALLSLCSYRSHGVLSYDRFSRNGCIHACNR